MSFETWILLILTFLLCGYSVLELVCFLNRLRVWKLKIDQELIGTQERFENLKPLFPRRTLRADELIRRAGAGENLRESGPGEIQLIRDEYVEVTEAGKRIWTKEDIDNLVGY